MLKTLLKWIIGLLIGAFFVYLSLRQWPIERIFTSEVKFDGFILKSNDWHFNLLYILLYFLTLIPMHIFRVIRWKPLLNPLSPTVDIWRLNRVCSVGFMSVFIFPLRLGELVRPYLISEKGDIRMSSALATIVVERVIDGLMIAIFLFIALLFLPELNNSSYIQIQTGTYIALLIFSLAILFLIFSFIWEERAYKIISLALSPISKKFADKIISFLKKFIKGLRIFPDIKNFILFIIFSLFYWLSNGIGLYIFAGAFGFAIPLLCGFMMMSCVVIGMMIPNSPANVGSFWYFLLLPLELYGINPQTPAPLIYAFCVWGIQLFQLCVFGGYFLLSGKVSFKRVIDAQRGKIKILNTAKQEV